MKVRAPLLLFLLLSLQWCPAATFVVTTASDELDTPSGSELSLREAIRDAGTSAATICFDAALSGQEILLTGGILGIFGAIGESHGKITIDASSLPAPVTLLADGGGPILGASERDLELINLVVSGGGSAGAGALQFGFDVDATLRSVTVRDNVIGLVVNAVQNDLSRDPKTTNVRAFDCEFYDNHLLLNPVGIAVAPITIAANGVGRATVRFERCSIYHNTVRSASGVIFFSGGQGSTAGPSSLDVLNCTLAENALYAALSGGTELAGVIRTADGGSVDIENSTVVDNLGHGLVVEGGTNVGIRETILAQNVLDDGSLANLSGPAGSLGSNLTDGNLPAVFNAAFDQINTDPRLSSLGYHGGKVLTCYPLAGSPAIDGGNPSRGGTQPTVDARGVPRLFSNLISSKPNVIDIGAVEIRSDEDLVVTSDLGSGAGTLREALDAYALSPDPGGRRIVFDPSLSGATITLSSNLSWSADKHVDIDASALSQPVTLEIDGDDDILLLSNDSSLSLHGVGFSGFSTAQVNSGQGFNPLRVLGTASLGLDCVTFENNLGPYGGGIQSRSSGRIHLTGCQFEANQSTLLSGNCLRHDAAAAQGMLVQVWKSSFVGNSSTFSTARGAIEVAGATNRLEVRNSTFHGNESAAQGSCVAFSGSGGRIAYCSFVDNTGSEGAVRLDDTGERVAVTDSLFADNTGTYPDLSVDVSDSSVLMIVRNQLTGSAQVSGAPGGAIPASFNRSNADFSLAPLAIYEGKLLTTPLLAGSFLGLDSLTGAPGGFKPLRALDINRGIGVINDITDIGAVEGALSLVEPMIEILGVGRVGSTLEVTFLATPDSRWKVEGGVGFTFGDLIPEVTATGAPQLQSVPLPGPVPASYFVQFVALP